MNYLVQYADLPAALAARPELQAPIDPDNPGAPRGYDSSYCMIVSAYTVPPVDAGAASQPGTLATGVWVLDSSINMQPLALQLPPGIKYIEPIYAGMLTPIPG